jgi:hypothetical protein
VGITASHHLADYVFDREFLFLPQAIGFVLEETVSTERVCEQRTGSAMES